MGTACFLQYQSTFKPACLLGKTCGWCCPAPRHRIMHLPFQAVGFVCWHELPAGRSGSAWSRAGLGWKGSLIIPFQPLAGPTSKLNQMAQKKMQGSFCFLGKSCAQAHEHTTCGQIMHWLLHLPSEKKSSKFFCLETYLSKVVGKHFRKTNFSM